MSVLRFFNYSTSTSIKRKLLKALLMGEELTTLTGNHLASTVDFRKSISELRKKGYPIRDKWDTNPNNNKRFKRYFLDQNYLKQV